MRVAVLFGGRSAEREVSLASGTEVALALGALGYEVETFDVTAGLFSRLAEYAPDVVFIGLHGRLGEDGTMQGALEVLGIPYVGSGVLASALAMDKRMTKAFLAPTGVRMARDHVVRRATLPTLQEAHRIGEMLGWPLIVKPNQEGSTIGLTLAKSPADLIEGCTKALAYDTDVLVEEYVAGTEVTAVVVGPAHAPEILEVIEIVPRGELYDYDSKYSAGGSEHIMPARLSTHAMEQVKAGACEAYRALGCRDYARVDFIVSADGAILLEVNTLPGMTPTSLVPDAARARGMSFGQFLDGLVQTAFQRHHDSRADGHAASI
ncbi:MAG: D-alanine--D-alanine ligase [Firmicutes bacterium]|nr:D-alanine--D-alanine ligase [Bacillota bacterium]